MESGAGIIGARRAIAVAAAVCATASLVWGVGSAHGAPGDLLYQGCLTGDPAIGPGGSNACTEITGASASTAGDNTGLNFAFAVAVSPDGTSLYALAQGDDAIARFSRSASTGALTYQDCITGETESGPTGIGGSNACSAIASHKSQGTDSGFDDPYGMVISPDSTSVYVGAQNDDSVAHFSRNTTTGALTYQGCISGEIESGPVGGGGNDSCLGTFPTRKTQGNNSGVDKVRALAIDANGESVYAGAPQDDSIARFTRDAITGGLTYQNCLTPAPTSPVATWVAGLYP